ncbi:MAG: hypothetical protein HKN88_09705 [Gammaproteobacteria bacterium]|nr:class I SAM-dependent methyltransferase [Gammaproteobacteria bacterium]NNC98331.1 hypothetical protein [Gammaproteobacteria bacterium]NNM14410.1 hypothetical protein [Gammaproteobacteria bacterium]
MQTSWLDSDYGKFVMQQESKLIRQQLEVAAVGSVAFIGDDRFLSQICENATGRSQASVFKANFDNAHLCCTNNKNIETSSVSWVIVMHSLEQQKDPQALLREITRILDDGGRVSIIGFNPLRRWSRKFWFWKDRTQTNIHSELSQFRLQDWLHLLNYDVTNIHTLIAPNMSRFSHHQKKCSAEQRVTTYPLLGMVYHFEALLRYTPMTMVRNFGKPEKKGRMQLVSPSTRNSVKELMPVKVTNSNRSPASLRVVSRKSPCLSKNESQD